MSNKKLIIIIIVSVLLSILIVLLKNNGQGVDFSILCYGLIMACFFFCTFTLVYYSVRDLKYIMLKNYKIHRYYNIPEICVRVFQIITLVLYLVICLLCFIRKDLAWLTQFGLSCSCLYFFSFSICFLCIYSNEDIGRVVISNKEIEYKNILNYNIKKFNNNVSILEIITENKNYKINASKQMIEAFLIAYEKNNGPKVY